MNNFPKNLEVDIVNYDRGDILKSLYETANPNPPTISDLIINLGSQFGALANAMPVRSSELNITGTSGNLVGEGFEGNYSTLIITSLSVNASAEIQGRIGNAGSWKAIRLTDVSTGVETQVLTPNSLLRADIRGISSIRLNSPAGTSNINYCMK